MVTLDSTEEIAMIVRNYVISQSRHDTLYRFMSGVVWKLADHIEASNPKFDRSRFYERCGLNSFGTRVNL